MADKFLPWSPLRPDLVTAGRAVSIAAFPITIFIAAFLLFAVEPMMGKFILPWFGGTPSVWTTCILFFQLALLGGYAYAHLIATRLHPRTQARVHLALVAVGLIWMAALGLRWTSPLMPPASWKPADPGRAALRVLWLLCAGAGIPYFILSATAPLLQEWYARGARGWSAYRLYAVSNLGAMLGLLTYPFAVEPALSLHRQAWIWYALFVVFAIGLAVCAQALRTVEEPDASPAQISRGAAPPNPELTVQFLWVALAACAALIFLAVTNQLCENVAAVPFLWVLPLAIYLLSFVVCFGNDACYRRAIFNPALAAAIVLTCAVLYRSYTGLFWQAAIYSLLVACSCMVCHGELVRLKPATEHLTRFYLMISGGGALGGLFGAVLAPWLFRGYWELQLSIWVCAALLMAVLMRDRDSWLHLRRPVLALALLGGAVLLPELMFASAGKLASTLYYNITAAGAMAVVAVTVFGRHDPGDTAKPYGLLPISAAAFLLMLASVLFSTISANLRNNLFAIRNFYGAFAVIDRDAGDAAWHSYVLRHGRIVHGVQFPQPDKRRQPTAYFGPTSGIGLLMLHHPRRSAADPGRRSLRVGVVGLGIGTIAAFGRTGDYIRFYEINPAIIGVATRRNGYFTYIHDSRARVDIVAGDARLSMERELKAGRPQRFDILVIDAFSGDAIPVHLLTREAMAVYLDELNQGGVLALHISNSYLDLRPVIARLAQHYNLHSGWVHSQGLGRLTQTSDWVLLAREKTVLDQPAISAMLQPLETSAAVAMWTDDYSNLFQVLR